jgi:dienelactone hydrolase
MTETQAIQIPVPSGGPVHADWTCPPNAQGLVVFAHGSGSSRHSPRNRQVADRLQAAGLATVLVDLLTPDEDAIDQITRQFRFDIDRLSHRLVEVTQTLSQCQRHGWCEDRPLPIGYFGASTGAAAALQAAAQLPQTVRAVVSRGGRPDLARLYLSQVQAPTLLLVGEADPEVLRLNEQAAAQIPATKQVVVIPRASHLFEEPGTLEQVADAAAQWFSQHLAGVSPQTTRS